MPKLWAYKDGSGYYIRARPSDVGNVTYQLESTAADFLEELEYEPGMEIPWGIINPLRAAGLVYTHNQGVDSVSEDFPGLDPDALPTASPTEIRRVQEFLMSRRDIPDEVKRRLRSIFETAQAASESTLERFVSQLEAVDWEAVGCYATEIEVHERSVFDKISGIEEVAVSWSDDAYERTIHRLTFENATRLTGWTVTLPEASVVDHVLSELGCSSSPAAEIVRVAEAVGIEAGWPNNSFELV